MKSKDYGFNQLIERDPEQEGELAKEYTSVSDELLSKYGPEGAYAISKELIRLADEDMANGMQQN